MKVKCVRYFDSYRQRTSSSAWLTVGRVYHVMGIHTDQEGKKDYLIITNERDPGFAAMGYQPAESFEILSDLAPPNWQKSVFDGEEDVLPAAWQADGFLDAFYDGDPNAYEIFEREREIVLRSDP